MAGVVSYIVICPVAGQPMGSVDSVVVIAGSGLDGDRYSTGNGTWNKDKAGSRQVSFINIRSFNGTGFTPADSRRNIVVNCMELMTLINKTFMIGDVKFRGVKYCSPCDRPDNLAVKNSGKDGFVDKFCERGGLLAEVLVGGKISVNDVITVLK